MTTTENNKLIAEFMGRSISPITLAEFRKLKPRDKHLVSGAFVEDLQYHSDWNWLMQVAEKIDEVCGIDLHEWDEHINNALCSKSLSTTYNACVEFVQWHNNQNK
jgi:hypothetical protein